MPALGSNCKSDFCSTEKMKKNNQNNLDTITWMNFTAECGNDTTSHILTREKNSRRVSSTPNFNGFEGSFSTKYPINTQIITTKTCFLSLAAAEEAGEAKILYLSFAHIFSGQLKHHPDKKKTRNKDLNLKTILIYLSIMKIVSLNMYCGTLEIKIC